MRKVQQLYSIVKIPGILYAVCAAGMQHRSKGAKTECSNARFSPYTAALDRYRLAAVFLLIVQICRGYVNLQRICSHPCEKSIKKT